MIVVAGLQSEGIGVVRVGGVVLGQDISVKGRLGQCRPATVIYSVAVLVHLEFCL